jgi:cyclic di-GMP phosphodiesterase
MITRMLTPTLSAQRPDAPRCLVVDDEPRLRQILVRLMLGQGFACEEASNGVEALARMAREEPVLVLSDLQMPEMDGAQLLRETRSRYPDVAVVMITGVADVKVAIDCMALGAMDYLTKPFHLEEVQTRVKQALEKRRLIIENREYQARLEQRVRAQARKIEELFLASIQALAHALEVKDPYTRGHSARVSETSVVIARLLGTDAELVEQIELGGNLHDIGKIGVREAVLQKPGPLSREEYEHIMTHPVVGWQILSPLLRDHPVALGVIRSHHERFDGKGVPDGLRGEDIPLAARIVAVTDAFDAMMSGRPYRSPRMSVDQCLAELRRCRGTQFDPNALDAFLRAVTSGMILPPTAVQDSEVLGRL